MVHAEWTLASVVILNLCDDIDFSSSERRDWRCIRFQALSRAERFGENKSIKFPNSI